MPFNRTVAKALEIPDTWLAKESMRVHVLVVRALPIAQRPSATERMVKREGYLGNQKYIFQQVSFFPRFFRLPVRIFLYGGERKKNRLKNMHLLRVAYLIK